jgi:hypothetical protein
MKVGCRRQKILSLSGFMPTKKSLLQEGEEEVWHSGVDVPELGNELIKPQMCCNMQSNVE